MFIKRILILFTFCFALLGFFNTASAATYYVSSTGSDSNNGTTTSTPWQTLSKVNSSTFIPGDSILFKKGDTFYGSITVSASGTAGSPITFSSYGTGNQPIITGFTDITNWTNLGSNIWESTNTVSTLDAVNMVTVNDVNTEMGRYPNSNATNGGYLKVDSTTANTNLTSSSLTGTPNWTGAEVVTRGGHFLMGRSTITSQSGSTINFNAISQGGPAVDFGFFIQNDARTLDQQNEWYYNKTTHKIQMYSTSQPSGVKVASVTKLITIQANYLTFDNLTFTGANELAFYAWDHTPRYNNVAITNCSFLYMGVSAIYTLINYLDIENNTILESNGSAISVTYGSDITIKNNNIQNIGIKKGMKTNIYSGNNNSAVESSISPNLIIESNIIKNTGYNAIAFYGDNILIKNNFIDTYCTILDDGGGIYTFTGPRTQMTDAKIIGNIVINGNPDISMVPASTEIPLGIAPGIYLDERSKNVEVANNSVANTSHSGIFINSSAGYINVHDNTVYNASSYQLYSTYWGGTDIPPTNNQINSNIFVSKLKDGPWNSSGQKDIFFYFSNNNAGAIGTDLMKAANTLDNNWYARLIGDNDHKVIRFADPLWDPGFKTLSEWQAYSGQDLNSHLSSASATSESDIQFEYNATTSNRVVTLTQPMIDVTGAKYATSLTLLPYTSIVLIKDQTPGPRTYYISPSGDDNTGSGTISSPWFSLNKAWTVVSAGDTIYLRGGTYAFTSQQYLTGKNGISGNLIKVWAYPGEIPNLTKSSSYTQSSNHGIFFHGDYVHFKGLEISGYTQPNADALAYGFKVENSNYNIFENLNVHNNGLGMAVSNLGSVEHSTGNLVLNSDFHHNQDPYTTGDPYGNADGLDFGWVTHTDDVNYIKGCRFWWNSDDGLDLYMNDGFVQIENSQAFYNGYIPDTFTAAGDGNGIKLGTSNDYRNDLKRVVLNSMAVKNKRHGFDTNDEYGIIKLYNCDAYLNGGAGILLSTNNLVNEAKNCITYSNTIANGLSTNGTYTNNSWQNGLTVNNADFVSLDLNLLTTARQSDGSLTSTDFLKLASGSDLINSGVDVGLPYNGSAPDLGVYESNYTSDSIPPSISSFTIPSTSSSLVVSISTFTANDAIGVTGYKLTESSTAPLAGDSGWTGSAPTTYTFATAGSKTLYAWAKDAAGNVSVSVSGIVVITLPPVTATTFTFTGPTLGNINTASTNFTITPNNIYTGTITITPSGAGSTGLSSITKTFSSSSTAQTFTITPTVAGSISLTPTNNGGLTNPANLTYTSNAVAPGAPTSVSAGAGNASATVSFLAPSSNGGSSITGYTVTSIPSGGTDTNAGTTSLSHLITGLTNGTPYTFTVKATNAIGQSVASTASSAVTPQPNTFTLTYTANSNGAISGATPQTVNSGSSGSAVTAVPSTGYHFVSWSDSSTSNPRTDTNIIAGLSVSATFAINTYSIISSAGTNGTISPSGTTTKNYATNQTYTITPSTGYHISDILVDGISQGTTNTYTFTNITTAHTISATFAVDVVNTFTLTINKVGTGTGVATGATTYNSGTVVTATATADSGSTFTSWGGDCNTSGQVAMTADKVCIATFTIIPVVSSGGGGGGGGGGSSSSTVTNCLTNETLINNVCVKNITTSTTIIEKAKTKDVKKDGNINIIDFNVIMANWNKDYKTQTKEYSLSKGDITGDGIINIFDINQLMVYWGVKY